MPSYFYHLKFELYPTADPTTGTAASGPSRSDIWVPPPDASVFDDLPSHPRPDRRTQHTIPRSQSYQGNARAIPLANTSAGEASGSSSSALASAGVIDCGAPRQDPTTNNDRRIEIVSERQWLERTKSFPPPSSSAAIRPDTAAQDWRFGRVSIETLDLRRGTGSESMSSDARAGPSAAPTLGPAFGGAGTATRAEFLRLETRNTEVGWGVVHFYRDGEETPELSTVEQDNEEQDEEETRAEDHTTLCIPAVPAYMSPGDFLGFVGERWRDDISHCRMVMTSRMNRYLVLLKFRDGKRAKQWRREFDGKVFNTMEVSCY